MGKSKPKLKPKPKPKRKCDACGKPIPAARLKAIPNTIYCLKCTDEHSPQVIHDPEVICAKPSPGDYDNY